MKSSGILPMSGDDEVGEHVSPTNMSVHKNQRER